MEKISNLIENQSSDIADAWGTTKTTSALARVARMPVERYSSEYNMKHKHRGIALIFNHEYFEDPSLKPRAGTNVDCENLTQSLKDLKFAVTVYKDLCHDQIRYYMNIAATQNHEHHDCILISILSHGDFGHIYAKDTQYKLDELCSYFTADRCPTLAGKPKLFVIQACQGNRLDTGIRLDRTETDGNSDALMCYTIPVQADFLFAYSTIPGYYSWRNTTRGSWFIQCLCMELRENGLRYDLLTLLTFVIQRVAMDFESNTPDDQTMHQKKQIPCLTSMLTRLLKFN